MIVSFERWTPQLRRAVTKVRPEFFAWSAERQHRYAWSMPEEDKLNLVNALLAELGIATRFANYGEALDFLVCSRSEASEQYGEATLPLYGIGEDCLEMEDYQVDLALKAHTLRDYDEAWHLWQQQLWQEHGDPAPNPYGGYRGTLGGTARFFIGRQLTRANLDMAAQLVAYEAERIAYERMDERIADLPRRDAQGREGLRVAVERRIWAYRREREDALASSYAASGSGGVFFAPTEDEIVNVVFTNTAALAAVRLRSFVCDCRAIERPCTELEQTLREERAAAIAFVERTLAELSASGLR